MKVEEFGEILSEKHGDKYGLMPPPTSDKEGMDILIEHFLEGYYSVNPINREQFNTEAICMILEKYPVKRNKDSIFRRLFKR